MPLFSKHGDEFRPATVKPGQRLVWTQVESGDESYDSVLLIVDESSLTEAPPTRKIDQQIADRREILAAINEQIKTARSIASDAETQLAPRMEKLTQYKGLSQLEEFIEGKVTHYVTHCRWNQPTIIESGSPVKDGDGDAFTEWKLLTLYGSSDGNLQWELNNYSDGSGGSTTVIPCTSYNNAIDAARALFLAHDESATKNKRKLSQDWVDAAEAIGLSMSDEYLAALQTERVARRERDIKDAEDALAKLRDEPTPTES